jgi:opacity protein-like surface antigen
MTIRSTPAAVMLLGTLGLLAAPTAECADRGFYLGGGYAQSTFDADLTAFDSLATDVYDFFGFTVLDYASELDDEDSGYEFLVGYRLYSWLAFEAGYLDAGAIKHTARAEVLAEGQPLTIDSTFKTDVGGIAVSALGIWQATERFSLYARAGLLLGDSKTHLSLTDGASRVSDSVSESQTSFLWGAGAGFEFADIYTVRLEYRQIMDAGSDDTTGKADAEVLSLGVVVAFNL